MPSYVLDSYTITEYYNFISNNSIYINNNFITINEFNSFIQCYMNKILYNYNYNNDYKRNKNFIHLNLIGDIIVNSGFDKNELLLYNYILSVSNTMKGQLILYKLISYLDVIDINKIVKESAETWTLPIFLFYINYYFKKISLTTDDINYLIITSFKNTDDRIYKYIINYNLFNITTLPNEIVVNCIKNICDSNSPSNYLLKKVRYLNRFFPDLYMYLNEMIFIFSPRYIHVLPTLFKFYYKKSSVIHESSFREISLYLIAYDIDYSKDIYTSIYNYLNTTFEKNCLYIFTLFNFGESFNTSLIKDDSISKLSNLISNNIQYISNNIYKTLNINDFKQFINSIDISDYIIIDSELSKKFIWTIMPFIIAKKGELASKFNLIRYNILKYIKKNKKNKEFINKLILYKKNKLKVIDFKLPPIHLHPNQLYNFEDALLKEKPDGVLVYELPKDIFPNIIFTNQIKAEYIEELDLYLVFDIEINYNNIERHKYIHETHEYGQKEIPFMNKDNMLELIKKEQIKLKEFLKQPYNNYRWYPKPAWLINVKNMAKLLIDIINMELIIDYSLNEINYDGFILTPFNHREIKIKPKKYYTIDLLYKNNKFYDRDEHVWDINTDLINSELINYSIYRCYPENNKWVCKEIRNDKMKPNTNMIVNNIINLYNSDYTDYNYYEKNHNSIEWKQIINDNNNIIKMLINKINQSKQTVLDLGCGYNRIIPYINYDYYVGIDINQSLKIDLNKPNVMNLNYNLNNGIKISFFKKFNLVTCINSIMHFSTDLFWSDLNKIVDNNCIMLVNVLEMDNIRYERNDYFIERDNNYVIYKFPIHNKIKQENYINIEEKFNKYGWKIIDIFKPNNDNLTKLYKWYIVMK